MLGTADLNQDGVPDLVSANYSSDRLLILLGNGNGSFTIAGFVNLTNPKDMVLADINGDGRSDIAVLSSEIGRLSILLGNGNGTFETPDMYDIPVSATSLGVGDFNRDNRADLVVASLTSPTLAVFLGNANGTLRVSPPVETRQPAKSVTTGDFDGDGWVDLVYGFFNSGFVVRKGNGDGTFGLPAEFTGLGRLVNDLAGVDFNNDGRTDLATVTTSTSGVSLYLNSCTDQCMPSFDAGQSFDGNHFPFEIAKGDFNNDGNLDLVTVNCSIPGTISLLLGNGNGSFAAPVSTLVGELPSDVEVGDFNRDGRLDLAVVHLLSTRTDILLNTGTGTFAPPVSYVGASANQITSGDFNNDTYLDLAVSNSGPVYFGNGNGTFTPLPTNSGFDSSSSVCAADLDQDGRSDLIGNDTLQQRVHVFRSLGNGFVLVTSPFADEVADSIVTGDFNRDGRLDIAVSNRNTDSVSVVLNLGNMVFSPKVRFPVGDIPESLVVDDFNNDGRPDLAVANYGVQGRYISILLGDGTGGFTSAPPAPALNPPLAITTGDFNNDGKHDIATADFDAGMITVRLNLCASCQPLTLGPTVPDAVQGVAYHHMLSVGGGTSPYHYALAGGALPPGLSLSTAGGLTGTPTQSGVFSFGVSVFDANGCSGSRSYSLRVLSRPVIAMLGTVNRIKGIPGVNSTIATVSDLETPAGDLTVTAINIPTGITLTALTNNQGTIRATIGAECEAAVGSNSITLNVIDGEGQTATGIFVVSVSADVPPTIGNYPSQTTVAGNTFTVTPSSPPTGGSEYVPVLTVAVTTGYVGTLSVNPTTGVVTANPVKEGTFMIFVRAVGLCGASVSKTFTLTVLPFQKGPLVEALSPPAGLVGTKVVLTGINFERVSEVRFNGLPASFTIDSPSQVTAVVPVNATTGPITVSGSGGATVGPVFTVIRTK